MRTRIISFDPSSTTMGYAIAEYYSPQPGAFVFDGVKIGLLKPVSAKDKAQARIDYMVDGAISLINSQILSHDGIFKVVVVIEISSGKVNHNRHGGGGAGLSTYGDAVGSLRTAVRLMKSLNPLSLMTVHEVEENAWTRGHSKEKRRLVALKYFQSLANIKDPGNDASDAGALAYWYFLKEAKVGKIN